MAFLEIDGQRHPVPTGELVIGSDASSTIVLSVEGMAPRHAIVQGRADGQVIIRKAADELEVHINGVRLGPQPTPLLHGDKVEIAGQELLFVDERRSGSTQYVQAYGPSTPAQADKPAGKRAAAVASGGRLVSLTDGREYAVTGASLLIGRDAACDVVITSKNVSRRHAEIVMTPKGYVLVDNSTNGTIVNGERVAGQCVLARGDVIVCGEHEFRFYADVAPTAPPAALKGGPPRARAPAGAPEPRGPRQAAPGPPPGAEHRLSNTLHGVPAVKRPAREERAPPPAGRPPTPPKRPGATPVLANLVVRGGPLKGRRFPIKVPVANVGRADYNDVVIPDASVSTTHAKLQRREGIWILVDVGSTNGTQVDGEPVQGEVPLAPGAIIRFGDVPTLFEPTDDAVGARQGAATKAIDAAKVAAPPRPAGAAPPAATEMPPPAPSKPRRRRTAPRRPRTAKKRRTGGRGWRLVVLLLLLAATVAAYFLLGT